MMLALELKNISKTFGVFKANNSINLAITDGEVHAILGENGAGKSTLMKTIYGEHHPDPGGEIFLRGNKIEIDSPAHAIRLGIGMVHQHFRLVRPFTILQNVILGIEPRNFLGMIDYKKARAKAEAIALECRLDLDFDQKIENVSVGAQQRVEIFKTLYRNAEIIILDEPTAVLTPQEIKDFYVIIKNLKARGKTIIIITHKLHEIKEIADRCTIIRKGKYIETVDVNSTSEEELASKMVGRKVDLKVSKSSTVNSKEVVFKIQNINVLNGKSLPAITDFSFALKKGEITGLAGIDGNGQSELVEALIGLRQIQSGKVLINEQDITNLSPKAIYHKKLGAIPEDRQRVGLVMDFKVKENFVLQKIDEKPFSNYGFIINRELNRFSNELIARFDIRPTDPEIKAASLSGGNQQKIILAREIVHNPDVLIAFQPTRGLDVGAIEYVHHELLKLRDAGKAILLISYELDEIINLSDRIGVIYKGHLWADLGDSAIKNNPRLKEEIGLYMAGGKPA
ncbi:MAG: ABC transporter ATP-binding protein [Bacteriovorax sp.]|nr:ABC transporter ATP-binding protein [Bacteriovorax sp.]